MIGFPKSNGHKGDLLVVFRRYLVLAEREVEDCEPTITSCMSAKDNDD